MKNKYLSLFGLIFTIGVVFYYLRFAITPFVISLIVAYLTMPVVNFAEKYKISRGISSCVVVVALLCCLFYVFALLIPFLLDKISLFFAMCSNYVLNSDNLHQFLLYHFSGIISDQKALDIQNIISDLSKDFVHIDLIYVFNNIKASGSLAINVVIVLIPCPVITFFMLRDWQKMIIKIHNAIPRRYVNDFIAITDDMESSLSKYLRGQIQVCLLLSVFYSIPLYLIGLNFGIAIGILTGTLAFIPYIGVIISAIVTTTVAAMQFGDVQHVLMVLSVLLAGQAIDGSMITPRIIGEKVNIHPTWVILGLFTSVVLFGTVGAIFALPLTACGSVIVKFAVRQYQQSQYYRLDKIEIED